MVVIAVAGSASRSLPPERGTVHLRVVGEGDDAAAAAGVVRPLLERLADEAGGLEREGAVTRWSAESLTTSVEHRFDGDRRERVHVATAPLEVRFRDLERARTWIGRLADEPAVRLDHVAWTLTSATRTALQRELRGRAVQDAVQRAADYAAALGVGEVRAVRLWEAGLRSAPRDGWVAQAQARAMAGYGDGDGAALHPAPIEVVVEVTADFEPV